jgi:hypothetical protein
LRKGYFTGTELFLNDEKVISLLIEKTESGSPLDKIHALNLLERSGYRDSYALLFKHLQEPDEDVRKYVIARIMDNNMSSALPLIHKQLSALPADTLTPELLKASYFLDKTITGFDDTDLHLADPKGKKAIFTGLLSRKESTSDGLMNELIKLARSNNPDEKIMVIEILGELSQGNYELVLKILLNDTDPRVYKKAMEVSGKLNAVNLFSLVIDIAEKHKAWVAFQMAIIQFGDSIFNHEYLKTATLSEHVKILLVKTAGRIKGDHSLDYLLNHLETHSHTIIVIEALWQKRVKLPAYAEQQIKQIIHDREHEDRLKVVYYRSLEDQKIARLLQLAIKSEIQEDVVILLKALSLIYDAQKINRVIELLMLNDNSKISNAIEMLEIIVPAKYFVHLNVALDLLQDINNKKMLIPGNKILPVHTILEDILKKNKAGFDIWTSSIACYMLPRLKDREFALSLMNNKIDRKDHLFNETSNYVLSMLK